MDKNSIQQIISHVNNAKRDIEGFPRSGFNNKSLIELDLALETLNKTIMYCNDATQN